MGRRKCKGQPLISGKRNNETKRNCESRTTSVIVKNGSNNIIVNTTTIGDLSKHRENVVNKVNAAIKLVESLEHTETDTKDLRYPIDHIWTDEAVEIANEILKCCVKNKIKITK